MAMRIMVMLVMNMIMIVVMIGAVTMGILMQVRMTRIFTED